MQRHRRTPRHNPSLATGCACLALTAAAVTGVTWTQDASAAAWTRAEGSSLFSVPLTFGNADESFDEDGNRVDRLEFDTMEVTPTYEYGVSDDLTVGVAPRYVRVEQATASGGTQTNEGVADAEIYARKNLWREGDAAFSTQALVKLPVEPDEDADVPLGRDQVDAELSLMYGDRHRGENATFFYNVDIGYRKRFEDPDDQVSIGGFAGWSLSRWTFLVTSDNTIGLDDPKFNTDEVLTAGRTFTQHKLGLVASYRLTDHLSIGANASTTYAGESVGATNYYGVTAFATW